MRIGDALLPALMKGGLLPDSGEDYLATGIESLDNVLGGGIARGRLHEVYAAEQADCGAAAGFTLALARSTAGEDGAMLWLRTWRAAQQSGVMQAPGYAEMGAAPGSCLFGVVADNLALLRAATDALRSGALSAMIVESRGRMAEYDLTASRRLSLAAKQSGTTLFLLCVDSAPVPSAAQTRWQVAAAPSRALPGNAPGHPNFDIHLLRQRSGPSDTSWQLEWDRDRRVFTDAAYPGALVSVPVRRPTADDERYTAEQPGRRAA